MELGLVGSTLDAVERGPEGVEDARYADGSVPRVIPHARAPVRAPGREVGQPPLRGFTATRGDRFPRTGKKPPRTR